MVSTLLTFTPLTTPRIRASSETIRKPDPTKTTNHNNAWWGPLFGWSSDPDYVNTTHNTSPVKQSGSSDQVRPGPSAAVKFPLGCFTAQKAKQMRKKTLEGSTFHDAMYHSAIASRLASDFSGSGRVEK